MGSILCCSQQPYPNPKIRVVNSKNHISNKKPLIVCPDTSSTSDSQTQNFFYQETPKLQKVQNFINYLHQRDFQISSIRKLSQNSERCSERKTFIKYLQKLQRNFSPIKDDKDSKPVEASMKQDKICKVSMEIFIEHSNNCPTCYQLFQNLTNIDFQELCQIPKCEDQTRISLRDSLLEFEKRQKQKRSAQCKCQILNSHQQAQKAMRKFPNTNKYQSKKLRFRKTSLFEPQIKQERQSQESS